MATGRLFVAPPVSNRHHGKKVTTTRLHLAYDVLVDTNVYSFLYLHTRLYWARYIIIHICVYVGMHV